MGPVVPLERVARAATAALSSVTCPTRTVAAALVETAPQVAQVSAGASLATWPSPGTDARVELGITKRGLQPGESIGLVDSPAPATQPEGSLLRPAS